MIAQIYTLNCAKTKEPFYIGCTLLTLYGRLYGHKQYAKRGNSLVCQHIRKLNFDVEIEYLDRVIIRDKFKSWRAYRVEAYWIEQFRQWGFKLANSNKNLSVSNKCYEGKSKTRRQK